MTIYDEHYDFDEDRLLTDEEIEIIPPSLDLVSKYINYVVKASKMEAEIPILGFLYLEKVLKRSGLLMNGMNWRRLVLVSLCLASKIWDDDSLEN